MDSATFLVHNILTPAQLNDIISLAVGLWAVKAAQKATTDKYSFGVGAPRLNKSRFVY